MIFNFCSAESSLFPENEIWVCFFEVQEKLRNSALDAEPSIQEVWNVEMREAVLEQVVLILNQISWCISRNVKWDPGEKKWDPARYDLFFCCLCSLQCQSQPEVNCLPEVPSSCLPCGKAVTQNQLELVILAELPTNSSSHAHEVPTNNSSHAIARFRRLKFALYHEAGFEINPEVLPLVSTCIKCREANGIIPGAGWYLRSFRDIVNMEVLSYRWNEEEDFLFGFILKSATDLGL